MIKPRATLAEICSARLLDPKRLIAPSLRVGQQWLETHLRGGGAYVNLSPTTLLGLMLELIGSELAEEELTYASPRLGELAIDAAWKELSPDGYLGRLERTPALSAAVYNSLLALRLAGIGAGGIDPSRLESDAKARDLETLLAAYETFLRKHKLLDAADVARRAIHRLESDSAALDPHAVILVPEGLRLSASERRFLDAIPAAQRIEMVHPADSSIEEERGDLRLLRYLHTTVEAPAPQHDGTVEFFHAVGEANEVRESLRRCLSQGIPLDEVEVLYSDSATYVPLIYGLARRYFAEPDRPEGIPVTFAEGIPALLSRPGRALAGWLEWIEQGYPQRRLVEMIGEGLFRPGSDSELGAHALARLLRPIAIGWGAENYLPKLDEQIAALKKSPPAGDDEMREARQRRRKGLRTLRRFLEKLLELSAHVASRSPEAVLAAAETFLAEIVHAVNELDRFAAEALQEQIAERRVWLAELGVAGDVASWLAALPSQTPVLGSGPRAGALHVAHLGSGGQSGRRETFVLGWTIAAFPAPRCRTRCCSTANGPASVPICPPAAAPCARRSKTWPRCSGACPAG
jgi:ATP-dependent helicase/nuclease subunit B